VIRPSSPCLRASPLFLTRVTVQSPAPIVAREHPDHNLLERGPSGFRHRPDLLLTDIATLFAASRLVSLSRTSSSALSMSRFISSSLAASRIAGRVALSWINRASLGVMRTTSKMP
jgi:hypothetical protein